MALPPLPPPPAASPLVAGGGGLTPTWNRWLQHLWDTLRATSGSLPTQFEKVFAVRTASGPISLGDGVYYSANNLVSTGDCTADAKSRIIGVAAEAIADTASGDIVKSGVVAGALSGATFNTRYYLGTSGQPVLAASIPVGARVIQLGVAKNATDLEVMLFDYGKKAA